MLNRLFTGWDYVRTSLWFVPALMVLFAVVLTVLTLRIDAGRGQEDAVRAWWLNSGDAEDARNLLSTLLTAIITMASMAFSVTVVALSLAASQFGPRLVRLFRADLRNQAVLGFFAATIVYCLLVLRMIHGKAELHDVPHVAVTVGTFLSLLCVLALLVFIQGVARSIVADEVVRRVGRDLSLAVAKLPPLEDGGEPDCLRPGDLPPDFDERAACLPLRLEGYVQAIDYEGLAEWAQARGSVLRLDFRPGDFVAAGDRCVLLYRAQGPLGDEAIEELDGFIVVGDERTPTQDIEFPIRHLVEIAVRALSPGVNDPFTAIAVIDRLRAAVSALMERRLPPAVTRDGSGQVRVAGKTTTYEGALDAAFNQIRQAGVGMPAITIHLLEALRRIGERAVLDEQREALAQHSRMVAEAAFRETPERRDRENVEEATDTLPVKRGAGAGIAKAPT